MNLLSDVEKLRYARQIVMADFGETGQVKIKQARILVVGIGGLGTFSSLLLAEIGVGYLRIVDRDIVEPTNLHRTPLYTTNDLDRAKVEVAADRLKQLNPSMIIDTHACHIGNANIDDLLDGIDIVIDALDNFETRRIINKACIQKGIPFIFCGVSARSGNLAVFNLNKQSPCFSCLYHGIDDNELESCDITGIHPAILPILTGIQVHEAVEIIFKGESSLNKSLLFIDLKSLSFDKIPIQKNPTCSVCSETSDNTIITPVKEWIPLDICGGNNFMLVPQMNVNFDIIQTKSQLEENYTITKMGTHSLTLSLPNNILMTIFKGGNVLIRGVDTPQRASKIWEEIRTFF
ncbi:MAG: HesA/MoeB/ThiF family protein [Candidatus Heimdallarchaeota archaeon]|nr:MAG: HesA/MoeB/ThiF family protein [Candidatus Heimdallarchaeota archaeon]